MKDFYIEGSHKGQEVTSYFALWQISMRKTRAGSDHLTVTLADKTGTIDGKMWTGFASAYAACREGDAVKVCGCVTEYMGKKEITLTSMELAQGIGYSLSDLEPTAPRPIADMTEELAAIIQGFKNMDLQRLVREFLNDPVIKPAFKRAPAAKVLHHAYIGGLLHHVLDLSKVLLAVSPFYPEVDPDLVITGAILHDIGKIWELEYKSSFSYTLEGQLIGHISIAQGMLREKIERLEAFPNELRILVEHMLLSHHGRLEFGSPKLPMTPEAILLSAVDDLEAKFASMRREFKAAVIAGKAPDQTTEWVRSMERSLFDSQRYLRRSEAKATAENGEVQEQEKIEDDSASVVDEMNAPPAI